VSFYDEESGSQIVADKAEMTMLTPEATDISSCPLHETVTSLMLATAKDLDMLEKKSVVKVEPDLPTPAASNGSPVSLSELDDLTDLFVAERNWQQELGSFNLTPISELDNMDTASSSSGSHFDFPDYASPEVSDILGEDLAWFSLV